MKNITRKHLWPAALVAALAVVGMLAAFVVLSGPERGAAEAQGSLCAGASGPTLAALMQAGLCQAATATPAASPSPSPTTGAGGGPPDPAPPGGETPMPTVTPGTPTLCDAAGGNLRALIQAGLCMEPTATPVPTATPEPTATPVPTATPMPTMTPEPTATPVPTMAPTMPAPGMPTRLTVSVDSDRTGVVELSWVAVAGAEGYLVVAYDLAGRATVGSVRMVDADADSLETEVDGLESGKEYLFGMLADFGEGMEPRYSGSVYITQKVTWAPSGS